MLPGLDLERSVVHNAAKPKYRSPLGALRTGESVELRLFIYGAWFDHVNLTLLIGSSSFDHAMHFADGCWRVSFDMPDFPCVLWYYFTLRSGDTHVYYGRNFDSAPCLGKVYWERPPAFQITVYDREFATPAWLRDSVMYQIFPDRFAAGDPANKKEGEAYHTSMGRDVVLHAQWDEEPMHLPLPGKQYYSPCDYFGGDIRGIINNLDYFNELGINLLYLNPVFEAPSNHRYNTADYKRVDPFLGTNADLEELFQKAGGMGIRVILDGVFSHTGDDSVYFNKYGVYPGKGAWQGPESQYYGWYVFSEFPSEYKSWWGFDTLPEVNEYDPGWKRFVIEGQDSILKNWLRAGAAGWRLDVADELPDDTIEQMRLAAKAEGEDNILLGEVWEDATVKQSYGKNRTYALGRALDSVMNYPLRTAILSFLTGKTDAYALKNFLVAQSQNYPLPMYFSLMNLLSTHDVERVHTVLSTGVRARDMTREQQAHYCMLPGQKEHGNEVQKLAALIQFCLPGVPCIYYGDEWGMDGLNDPFNRRTLRKENPELQAFYKKLSNIRRASRILKTGAYAFHTAGEDLIVVLRFVSDGRDMFDNPCQNGVYLILVNRSAHDRNFALDLLEARECVEPRRMEALRKIEPASAECMLTEKRYFWGKGLVSGELPPYGYALIQIQTDKGEANG